VTAIDALHADRSVSAVWRTSLELVFDVSFFFRALAINQVIMNWDSYGCMHHNYFVYANPKNGGRFLWLPWDLTEAMLYRTRAGCPDPGSVFLDEIVLADANDPSPTIDRNWRLIRFILADTAYREDYKTELRAALTGAFAAGTMIAQLQQHHALVAPHVGGPTAVETFPYTNTMADGFNGSLTNGAHALIPHVAARHAAVEAALGL